VKSLSQTFVFSFLVGILAVAAGPDTHDSNTFQRPKTAPPKVSNASKVALVDYQETPNWNAKKDPVPPAVAAFNTFLTPKKVAKFSPEGFSITEQRKKDFSVWFNRKDGSSHREVKMKGPLLAGPYQLSNGLVVVISGRKPSTIHFFETNGMEKASLDITLGEKEEVTHAEVKPDGTVVLGSRETTFHAGAAYIGIALFTEKARMYTLELYGSAKRLDSMPK